MASGASDRGLPFGVLEQFAVKMATLVNPTIGNVHGVAPRCSSVDSADRGLISREVVLQKSTPPQIRQLILYCY